MQENLTPLGLLQICWHENGAGMNSKPQRCIKMMEQISPLVMDVVSKGNPGLISGTNQRSLPGSVRFLSIFFTLPTFATSGKKQWQVMQIKKPLYPGG
jgi:hypothetical protein